MNKAGFTEIILMSADHDSRRYGLPSKPLEARACLIELLQYLVKDGVIPVSHRLWMAGAIKKRLADPDASLDQLLGLRSRKGGRLGAFSKNPARDKAIKTLAGTDGSVADRARALADRVKRHRLQPDPEISAIESVAGKVPDSVSQIKRIITGRTAASHSFN